MYKKEIHSIIFLIMKINFKVIEAKRNIFGENQKQFCYRLKISESTYSKMKLGHRKPTVEFIEKVYFETGLTLGEIFIFDKKGSVQ